MTRLPLLLSLALRVSFISAFCLSSLIAAYLSLNLSPPPLHCLVPLQSSSFYSDPFLSVLFFAPYIRFLRTFLPLPGDLFFSLSVKPILNFWFLSLHRDVRRLVVAMSRARLGLYVFGRVSLFQNCFELTPVFSQLTARPMQLHIRPHEYYSQEQPVRPPARRHTPAS